MEERKHVTENHMVYYTDLNIDETLKISTLARWFQNCVNKETFVMKRNLTEDFIWILIYYDISIIKYPSLYDEVTIETFASSFNSVSGDRMFLMKDLSGNVLAQGKSRWITAEKGSFKLRKISEETAKSHGLNGLDKGLSFKADSPKDKDFEESKIFPFYVRAEDIDSYGHVNNTVYFSYIFDFIPEKIWRSRRIERITVTYKNSLFFGQNAYADVVNTKEDAKDVSLVRIRNDIHPLTYIKIIWEEV